VLFEFLIQKYATINEGRDVVLKKGKRKDRGRKEKRSPTERD